ncbi:hypothetical protein Poli38472_012416 [Pythium oligandrum]|uniref:Transmembrane protein n=1 Tax=Pythium oligandrum TaxID=41045 RepID=A0A8K1CPU6_PYTOL|nr:hypothetical protein Poli38472_012416 [Pythium oligandrum]|eukprot:TMW67300.1 hypothetical protein Poli38472_012416 [Pythium oligandrum]
MHGGRRMRAVYVGFVVFAAFARGEKASDSCPASVQVSIAKTEAYQRCQTDSRFAFSNETSVDTSSFCRSEGCFALYEALQKENALSCTAFGGLETLVLWEEAKAKVCFGTMDNTGSSSTDTSSEHTGDANSSSSSSSAAEPVVRDKGSTQSTDTGSSSIVWIGVGNVVAIMLIAACFISFRRKNPAEQRTKEVDDDERLSVVAEYSTLPSTSSDLNSDPQLETPKTTNR